jgi:microcystin degradation protein MlrC
MRLLIAMLSQETNTFSPVRGTIERFMAEGELLAGTAARLAYEKTDTVLGGFLEVAASARAEVVVPLAAAAWPGGEVDDSAFEAMAGLICDEVSRGGFDGILLDLHGAMVTRRLADADGELLCRIRALDHRTPIGVALDMHANVSSSMIENSTVIVGYHTYPHVDMGETGRSVASLLLRTIAGDIRPTMRWANAPMLPHVMRQSTDDEPNRSLQRRCAELVEGRVLAASVFTGFPHADVHDAGLSAVAVTDADPKLADQCVRSLTGEAWKRRTEFVYTVEPLEKSVARAHTLANDHPGEGPVVLLDHYDNAASGGTMDTTVVLGEILKQGLEDVAAFAIYDPEAVAVAASAGVGSQVTLSIGGRIAMPAIKRPNPPLAITGVVQAITDGRFRYRGPLDRGLKSTLGLSAVVNTGRVEIALVSRQVEPDDLAVLFCLGIDPMLKRFLMLKSRISWRACFRSMMRAVVECAGNGVCTSDYRELSFVNLRRPVYPLDPDTRFDPFA